MKNYRLHIENFLTIEELELDLSPGISGFVGDNAQGKTNIITAIQSILSGSHDTTLIKDGHNRAEIRLEQVDENGDVIESVSRIQTQKGNRLVAKGIPSSITAKTYLSELLDDIALNPIKLISDDPVAYLKKHLPLKVLPSDLPSDLSEQVKFDLDGNPLDECNKQKTYYGSIRLKTYQEMRHQQEVVEELRKELPPVDSITAPYSPDELKSEEKGLIEDGAKIDMYLERRQEIVDSKVVVETSIESLYSKLNDFESANSNHQQSISDANAELERQIAELRNEYAMFVSQTNAKIDANFEKISHFKDEIQAKNNELAALTNKIKEMPIKTKDEIDSKLSDIERKRHVLEQKNQLIRRHEQVDEHEKAFLALEKRHSQEDALYKYFAYELPKILISRCDLHVDGLTFEDDQLFVAGRHINRLSAAERAIVAVKLIVELAKQKGHICVCIDGLEIMDAKHRKDFLDAMSNSGLRVIYTRMGMPEHDHETLMRKG